MNHYESADIESTDVEPRTERALTECMTVLPAAPGMYEVVGENGNETYTVDLHAPACTCNDFEYRAGRDYQPEEGCKHIRRARFATAEEPVPAGVDGVDPLLGEHTDAQPYDTTEEPVVATDGGQVGEPAGERVRVPVDGGILVFERRELGKELVGFESVDDWDGVATALRARGFGVGAIYHLPELDG